MGLVGVRFSESLGALISAEAESSKKTKSDIVRTAVCLYFGIEDQERTILLLDDSELDDRIRRVVGQVLEEKKNPEKPPKQMVRIVRDKT